MKSSRTWEAVVYPDSESYVAAESLAKATQYFGQWCYVLHDKDLNDDGTPKKAHYHVYGKLDTPRTPQSVANALGVGVSSLRVVSSWRGSVRYTLHLDHPDKYQYSADDVVSNFDIAKFLTVDDDVQAARIFSFIQSSCCTTVSELTAWAFANGCYPALRRGFAVWSRLLSENFYRRS